MKKIEIHLSFDDGSVYDLKLVDLLEKHDLKATFYIPVYWTDYNKRKGVEPLSDADFRMIADKYEIGSHTITHPLLTRIPYGAAEYEIVHSQRKLEEILGREVTKFAYPRGYATDQIVDIVSKTYQHGRSVLVGNVEPPVNYAWEHTSVHVACERREYGNERWFDYGVRHLERAKRGGYFHAWGHSEEIERNNAWGQLDRFLGLIKSYETASA